MSSFVTVFAGLFGAAGLAGAAYAAHGGDPRLAGFAAAIALVHAPALLALAALAERSRAFGHAAALMIVGVVLFSGDLILRERTGAGLFGGRAAPIGGATLMAAWLAVSVAAICSGYRRRGS